MSGTDDLTGRTEAEAGSVDENMDKLAPLDEEALGKGLFSSLPQITPLESDRAEPGGRDARDLGPAAESIEEIADDLLVLQRLTREISRRQADMQKATDDAVASLQEAQREQAAELKGMRRELLGERRMHARRSAFDAIHPALDQIELVRAALGRTNADAGSHISAVQSALRTALRSLGFVPFSVELGEPFDPTRMECVEYAAGHAGVVLAVVRPGYEADGVVVRPCAVAIAPPAEQQPRAIQSNQTDIESVTNATGTILEEEK